MNINIPTKIFFNPATYSYTTLFFLFVGAALYANAHARVTNELAQAETSSTIAAAIAHIEIENATAETAPSITEPPVEDIVESSDEINEVVSETNVTPELSNNIPVEVTEVTVTDEYEEDTSPVVKDNPEDTTNASPTELALPYTESDFLADSSSWGSGYGNVQFENNELVIGGGDSDTAFLALLAGSYSLSDYEYNVVLDWNRGKSVQLVARFADYGNFATCSYSINGSGVTIISTIQGERVVRASSASLPTKPYEGWKNLSFGVRTDGQTISCLKDGEVVLKQTIVDLPAQGGVGIALWSELPGEALASVKQVSISD